MENKFSGTDLEIYRDLALEELMILFLHEKPTSTFFKMRLHLIDFTETFGHLRVQCLTTDMLRTWLDQIQQENKIADTTMRSLKCSLDRLFEFLIEKEIISESPLKEIYYRKTPADAIKKALGFRPAEEAEQTDAARIIKYVGERDRKLQIEVVDRIIKTSLDYAQTEAALQSMPPSERGPLLKDAQEKRDQEMKEVVETMRENGIVVTPKQIKNEILAKNLTRAQRAFLNASDIIKGKTARIYRFAQGSGDEE
jgi:hypothetical protein